ncbi:MAG: DMT family transporter [Chloroflexi bacterium]|nr:MAG: DMT family transporter [Chloroflexota bacterium]
MTARQTGILLLLGAIWGAAFMLIKIAVSDVAPATLVAVRIAITAVILYAAMRVSGVTLPRERQSWFNFYSVGMFGLVIPFLLISWGQRLIPSSTTAILGATTPLFTALINIVTRAEEKINVERIIGLIVGFVGVIVAIGITGATEGDWIGELCVLGAAVCYAISALYSRRVFGGMKPIVPSTGQMIASASLLIPIALIWDGMPTVLPSAQSITALLILAVFCTAIAYILYYQLIDSVGATKASMVSFLIAPFGVVYGSVFLQEPINPNAIAGLAIIIVGIVIAGGSWRAILRKRPTSV